MQAYMAARLFSGRDIDKNKAQEVYNALLGQKQNIVLIGMPSAGKTSIGKLLSARLNMPFFDSDEQILALTGKTPAEIISGEGEAAFRKTESSVIAQLAVKNHCIIATGGGAVTVSENVLNLKANGKIYYLDRALGLLQFTADRPLSSSKQALKELYAKRSDLYKNAADVIIENNSDISIAAENIRKDFLL
ncbi:MAG: shikimate kinase, partial [Clostridia bacterium]|nr:shikimate kinase [Clostridia bacterium]